MNDEARKTHWENVYDSKPFTDVSWYQQKPDTSLRLIHDSGISRDDAIIDVGGGASTLVDHLLDDGYTDMTVLDLSSVALVRSRERLGARADDVRWIVADVTHFETERRYALWHDRAVLHFLTNPIDREHYVSALRAALAPGGSLVLATFGPDGPRRCSGLEVRRYDVDTMQELLGPEFELEDHVLEEHRTPTGGMQQFLCTRWRRVAP